LPLIFTGSLSEFKINNNNNNIEEEEEEEVASCTLKEK
jgi:hypothetical protein